MSKLPKTRADNLRDEEEKKVVTKKSEKRVKSITEEELLPTSQPSSQLSPSPLSLAGTSKNMPQSSSHRQPFSASIFFAFITGLVAMRDSSSGQRKRKENPKPKTNTKEKEMSDNDYDYILYKKSVWKTLCSNISRVLFFSLITLKYFLSISTSSGFFRITLLLFMH